MSTSPSDVRLATLDRARTSTPPEADAGPEESGGARPRGRRSYNLACLSGAVPALVAFVALAWNNGGFFAGSVFSGFYETQARALLHGRWNVREGSLGIEAFRTGSKFYEYYGPWPAVLRMPLIVVVPGMDGKWTQPSMLLALVVALAATSILGWQVRRLVRGDAPVTRVEQILTALFVFTVGAGSVYLFLASQAWVYHEAEIWGSALALASYAALVEYLVAARRSRLIVASLSAALAIMSRPSVGAGPVAALLLVAILSSTGVTRRLAGVPESIASWRARAAALASGLLPAMLYMYVNFAKFGSLLTFPSDRQIFSTVGVYRREMLAQNDNSLFGLKFAPTTIVQYLRPDALRLRWLLPFVDFPRTATVIGNARFDTIEPTSSVPSSMPLLALLATIGVLTVVTRAKVGRVATIRIVVASTALGAITVIPYSYIAQRYMSDMMPLLVVAGLVGLSVAVRWAADRRWRVRTAVVGVLVLALLSTGVNAALGYSYHYETELNPEGVLNVYLEQQYRIFRSFPGGRAPYVVVGDKLPWPPLARGTTFVVGDCDGVYWSQGNTWEPSAKWYGVARTRVTGQYDLRVVWPVVTRPTMMPLVVRGERGRRQIIGVLLRRKTLSFVFWNEDDRLPKGPEKFKGVFVGPALRYFPGLPYPMNVVMDSNNGQISATMAGYVGFAFVSYTTKTPQLQRAVLPTDIVTLGRTDAPAPMNTAFTGTITERRQPRPDICRYLTLPRQPRSRSGLP